MPTPHAPSGRRERPGFTLIEVLVVVAIIALLVSVLLPSLNRAREQSRVVICKTRMGQLYRGHAFYAADDKTGVFPHWSWWLFDGKGHSEAKINYNDPKSVYAKTGGVRAEDPRVWVTYGDIYKYVRNPETYLCPGDNRARPKSGSIKPAIHSYVRLVDPHFFIQQKIDGKEVNNGELQRGDFINPDKLRAGVFKGDAYRVPQASTFHSIASRVGMMYEEDQGTGENVFSSNSTLNDGHSSVVVYTDYMAPRHQRRGHLLYFDGHAELCPADRWNNFPKDKYVMYRVLGGGSVSGPRP